MWYAEDQEQGPQKISKGFSGKRPTNCKKIQNNMQVSSYTLNSASLLDLLWLVIFTAWLDVS